MLAKAAQLKPQDVLVLLKLAVGEDGVWSYSRIAAELGMSASEVHAASTCCLPAGHGWIPRLNKTQHAGSLRASTAREAMRDMSPSPVEAYDVIRHSALLAERLAAAQAELEKKRGLKAEKEWLRAAGDLLGAARELSQGIVERARGLPGLEEVRDELGAVFQGLWVDALERLLAGITFHAGPRAPLIEAVFPHTKLAALRRASRESALGFAEDLGRRMKTSYVTRTLAEPASAFALPVLDQLASAFTQWQEVYSGENMPEPQAAELLKELLAAAKRLELACRQAKLLAEAALAPCGSLFEELGLSARPKRRSTRSKEQPRVVGAEEPASPQADIADARPPEPEPEPGKPRRKKAAAA